MVGTGDLSAGQPRALGPSGSSHALPARARTQGQASSFPGPALRSRFRSASSPELSQTPPRIPRGKWPRTASSSIWGRTPVRGLESCLLSWRAALSAQGDSWPQLRTEVVATSCTAPTPAHTHTAQPSRGRSHGPLPGLLAPPPGPAAQRQCRASPEQDPRSQARNTPGASNHGS